jgi:tetratricopeptide (TPR) repeat protein
VARAFLAAAVFACVLSAQKPPQPAAQPPEPPEEDESLAPKNYALNPVQSKKEIVVGDQYFKKSSYSAAANRYLEASRWDPGSAEAFLKLGEAREKLRQYSRAREAYLKYIELTDDPKEKDTIRKKMDKLPDTPAQTKSPAKTTDKK